MQQWKSGRQKLQPKGRADRLHCKTLLSRDLSGVMDVLYDVLTAGIASFSLTTSRCVSGSSDI